MGSGHSGGSSGGGAMAGGVKNDAVAATSPAVTPDELGDGAGGSLADLLGANEMQQEEIKGEWLKDQDAFDDLRTEMGQTGYEAGKPNASSSQKMYVNTYKSKCINMYLNTDGKTFKAPGTDWHLYINESWIKNSISKMDKGMKPLTKNINLTRFVDGGALGKMLGTDAITNENFSAILQGLKKDKGALSNLGTALKNTNYTHKAYTSTNYIKTHPSYGDKAIRLNIVARKGTNAIITKNYNENEIVLGKGLKYNFTGAHVEGNQLVIDMYV